MQIREAFFEDFEELMEFYERMCRALGEKDFLPEGDKGGISAGGDGKGCHPPTGAVCGN